MKTFFVLFMLGVLQPTSPDYTEYVKKNGHSIVIINKIADSDEACGQALEAYARSARTESIEVVYTKCIGMDINMKQQGT